MGRGIRRYSLMIPGPTDSPDCVLAEMGNRVLPHSESEWAGIYWEIVEGLQKVIGTSSDVFPINGSGTLSFEIAMSSLLREGDRVLAVDTTDVGEEVGAACRERDVPFLVDCVSSLGGVPSEMDRRGVDSCCSSVQKCFDCPPRACHRGDERAGVAPDGGGR